MITFEELYEKRADYVFFLCCRLEYNRDRAESLNRQMWRRVRRQLPQLQGEQEEGWLCSKLVDTHRQASRRFRESDDMREFASQAVSEDSKLEIALGRLALEYRWPLILRECGGFSYEVVGHILGLPTGTVRARIGTARAMLHSFKEDIN